MSAPVNVRGTDLRVTPVTYVTDPTEALEPEHGDPQEPGLGSATVAGSAAAIALAEGMAVLAGAHWPAHEGDELPVIAGFVTSSFSPLAAALADLCLLDYFGSAPADQARGERTAIVLASSTGDLVTAAAIAAAVAQGRRVPPLLFFQSNPNAVAGHIAARWGLAGPVVCTIPARDAAVGTSVSAPASALEQARADDLANALADAVTSAALLIEDGDADAALVIAADSYLDEAVAGAALLIGPATWPPALLITSGADAQGTAPADARMPSTAPSPQPALQAAERQP